jgi:uncharacterized protein (TIGR00266 family)
LAMTSGLQLSAWVGRRNSKNGRGWYGGFKSLLGGENFFTSEFRAKRDGQVLTLAPDTYGDILTIPLEGSGGYFLTRGSYLANVGQCELTVKYGGMKGMMAKTGLFLLHAAGSGTVFCQTYGAIIALDLAEGENFFVDNRFVVAFAESVQYQLVKATTSMKDSLLSGEGLVNKYSGPGRVYYQTRGKPGSGMLTRVLDATF